MSLGWLGLKALTKISNKIFQLEFFQDWELAQNQLNTTGFSWTFFPTHFRPNWTRMDFFPVDKIGSNLNELAILVSVGRKAIQSRNCEKYDCRGVVTHGIPNWGLLVSLLG